MAAAEAAVEEAKAAEAKAAKENAHTAAGKTEAAEIDIKEEATRIGPEKQAAEAAELEAKAAEHQQRAKQQVLSLLSLLAGTPSSTALNRRSECECAAIYLLGVDE